MRIADQPDLFNHPVVYETQTTENIIHLQLWTFCILTAESIQSAQPYKRRQ